MPKPILRAVYSMLFATSIAIGSQNAIAVDRVVNNTENGGDGVCDTHCSLKDAVDAAIAGQDVVRFDPILFSTPQSISTSGVASIPFNKSLTLIGPGRDLLTLNRVIFRDNAGGAGKYYDIRGLTMNGGQNGFWIFNGAAARFEDVRFTNADPFSDAAIWVQNGSLTVSMCEFVNTSSFMDAGGISQDGGSLLNVNNSNFKNNSSGGAGAISSRAQQVSIIGNTFEGNQSSFGGAGAIQVAISIKAEIGNNTFYGNATSGLGAAILAVGNTQSLGVFNNTIVNNQGSVAAIYSDSPLAIMANNIIAMNRDPSDAPLPAIGGGGLNISHQNIISAVNLNLGPLANNGGLTPTMALLDNSSAIGAGDPIVCNRAPINAIDQRGQPRFVCDAGAYASLPEMIFADEFE